MEQTDLPQFPFSVLALAPFVAQKANDSLQEPFFVDPFDIDAALATLSPSLYLSLPQELCPFGGLELQFFRIRDFTPDGMVQNQPYLQDLLAADDFITKASQQNKTQQQIVEGLAQWNHLPPLPSLFPPSDSAEKKESSLDNILSMVALPGDSDAAHKNFTQESYKTIAVQILDTVFADPYFRRLEQCWLGLRYLASHLLKIDARLTLLPCSLNDTEQILEEIRDTVIRETPSLLLFDHPFSSSENSVATLDMLARFGQEMLVPVVTWLDAPFFQIKNWQDFDRLSFLPHYLEKASFAKFRNLQHVEQGRWLALACNRFLTRFAFGPDNTAKFLDFNEKGNAWIAPPWAVAALIASRIAQSGWPTAIASSRQVLENLALDMENAAGPSPVEIQLSESRLEQFARCGLLCLAAQKGTDKLFLTEEVMISADVSLSYQLLICRVSHFILWCRETWQNVHEPDVLAARLHRTFQLFIEKEGAPMGDLKVNSSYDKGELKISFRWQPSKEIIRQNQMIELEFFW